MVPVVRGKPTPLDEMVEEHPEFKKVYQTDDYAKQVIDLGAQT
jgi:hypothetical protein